jgi:hypothetical protein
MGQAPAVSDVDIGRRNEETIKKTTVGPGLQIYDHLAF